MESDKNKIDEINIEHYQSLMEYFRKSMEVRRSLELKFFVGAVVVSLLIYKEAFEHIRDLYTYPMLLWAIVSIYFGVFVIFTGVSIQMQYVNRKARQRYRNLEDKLFNHLNNITKELESYEENFLNSFKKSWSSTWTSVGLLILAIICSFSLWASVKNFIP